MTWKRQIISLSHTHTHARTLLCMKHEHCCIRRWAQGNMGINFSEGKVNIARACTIYSLLFCSFRIWTVWEDEWSEQSAFASATFLVSRRWLLLFFCLFACARCSRQTHFAPQEIYLDFKSDTFVAHFLCVRCTHKNFTAFAIFVM